MRSEAFNQHSSDHNPDTVDDGPPRDIMQAGAPSREQVRSISPTPSVLSLSPSANDDMFLSIDGMIYASKTGVYPFPVVNHLDPKFGPFAIWPERLSCSHLNVDCFFECLKLAMGGNIYIGPVEEVLHNDPHLPQKAVLDLGYDVSTRSFAS